MLIRPLPTNILLSVNSAFTLTTVFYGLVNLLFRVFDDYGSILVKLFALVVELIVFATLFFFKDVVKFCFIFYAVVCYCYCYEIEFGCVGDELVFIAFYC